MKQYLFLFMVTIWGTAFAQQPKKIAQQTEKVSTAEELYEKAFDYMYGRNGVIVDSVKAVELFEKSANMGFAKAQVERACVEKNDSAALKWLLKAAVQDCHYAMQPLFGIYYNGRNNVPKNNEEAYKWLKKGAELGNPWCQWLWGYTLHYGDDGIHVNVNQAIYWLEKAANQNQDDAMEELGELYQDGILVKRDIEKTIYWYKKASDLKNKIAIEQLATMYQYGDGVDINKEKAFKLMKEAASLGGSSAQIKTGIMYDEGIGCEKDRYAAEYWWRIALKNSKTTQENKEILKRWLDE